MTGSVARRWAEALFDLAREKGLIEQFQRQLMQVGALLEGHPEVVAVLNDRLVSSRDKKDLVDRGFPKPLHELVDNLLHLLIDKRREEYLPEIITLFGRLVDAHKNTIEVEVTSAVALDQGEQNRLGRALERATGRTVRLRASVDKDIIGGLVARIDDRLYDGSVRTQLTQLRREMARG
ncbi:MAG: ATP synthase F1 subunit delta [Bacillota bacterium]